MKLELTEGTAQVLDAYGSYWSERHKFLGKIGCERSNRDPLSEFSEILVASLTGGERAKSRTQKGWDIELEDGTHIEVKYLANPGEGTWPNEHSVKMIDGTEYYALVVYLDLYPRAVHVFPMDKLGAIYDILGKQHEGKGEVLNIGRLTHEKLMEGKEVLQQIGVTSIELPHPELTH